MYQRLLYNKTNTITDCNFIKKQKWIMFFIASIHEANFSLNLALTLPLASAPLPFHLIFGIPFLLRFVLNLLLIHSNHILKHSISIFCWVISLSTWWLSVPLILLFCRLCAHYKSVYYYYYYYLYYYYYEAEQGFELAHNTHYLQLSTLLLIFILLQCNAT